MGFNGFGFGGRALKKASSGNSAFDPATLALTIWCRGSFAASPWVGVASAGGSGARNLAEATNPPSAGAAVNGLTPASFDGSNDQLSNATSDGTIIPSAGYLYWVLFMANTIGTAAAITSGFDNDALFGETGGYVGAALTTNGGNKVQAWQFDATGKGNEHAISLGAWNLLCVRYDGVNLRSKLNSNALVSSASGTYDLEGGTMVFGRNYNAAQFADIQLLDIGMSASSGSDATFDDLKAYVNSRYALSL